MSLQVFSIENTCGFESFATILGWRGMKRCTGGAAFFLVFQNHGKCLTAYMTVLVIEDFEIISEGVTML